MCDALLEERISLFRKEGGGLYSHRMRVHVMFGETVWHKVPQPLGNLTKIMLEFAGKGNTCMTGTFLGTTEAYLCKQGYTHIACAE